MSTRPQDDGQEKLPADTNDTLDSRRRFIRKVGGAVFAITLLDIPDTASMVKLASANSAGCGLGARDNTCSATVADNNCGFKLPGGNIDNDQACSATDNDESCGTSPGDFDQSCSQTNNDEACGHTVTTAPPKTDSDQTCASTNVDENCGKTGPGGPFGTDSDQSCSTTSNDANCQVSQVPKNGMDVDQNCTATGANPDESCGDCDDNHNRNGDQHCGKPVAGAVDPDGLCGHQHWVGHSEDHVCSATQADVGCGTHTTVYGGTDDDPDQHCSPPAAADMHCAAKPAIDANCNAPSNPSTTSPDENCSATDTDQACGHYDADESCSGTTADEACGLHFGVFGKNQDIDNFCAAQGGTNATDNSNIDNVTL